MMRAWMLFTDWCNISTPTHTTVLNSNAWCSPVIYIFFLVANFHFNPPVFVKLVFGKLDIIPKEVKAVRTLLECHNIGNEVDILATWMKINIQKLVILLAVNMSPVIWFFQARSYIWKNVAALSNPHTLCNYWLITGAISPLQGTTFRGSGCMIRLSKLRE